MTGHLFQGNFAAIDIGSHTTRMIIARKDGNELTPLSNVRRVTRLAQGFQHSNIVSDAAQDRNISALNEYTRLMRQYGVERVACGATGVVRRAENSRAVVRRIEEETGIGVEILSEEKEAFLSARGMLSFLPKTRIDTVSFDIGGGSTEFLLVTASDGKPAWSTSRPAGAAIVTEKFLNADPPAKGAAAEAASWVAEKVLSAKEEMWATLSKAGIIVFSGNLQVAGTAGTVSTLAAIYLKMATYVPYRINGLVLKKGWVADFVQSLAEMPLAERRLIPGLEPGREDIILGGAIIVSEILSGFGAEDLVVTDAGLLEGLLLELVENVSQGLTTDLTWRIQKG